MYVCNNICTSEQFSSRLFYGDGIFVVFIICGFWVHISGNSLYIDVRPRNSASIDADCLVGGGKPEQFSAFGREVPCETTAPGR